MRLDLCNIKETLFLSSASLHVTGIIDKVPSEELGRGLMLLSKVGV